MEQPIGIQEARHAIVTAIQILKFTPASKLAQIHEILYGSKIESARAEIHAGMYEKMFDLALRDIDERHRSEPETQEIRSDLNPEGSA